MMEVTISTQAFDDKVGHLISMECYKDKLQCNPSDPYGFWSFSWATGGDIPTELEGHFTSWLEAEKILNAFINSKEAEEKSREDREAKVKAKEEEILAKSAKARAEWTEEQKAKKAAAKQKDD